jgi:hypothetical protein
MVLCTTWLLRSEASVMISPILEKTTFKNKITKRKISGAVENAELERGEGASLLFWLTESSA